MYLFLDLVYKCYLLHSEQFIRHHLHFYKYPCVIRYNWYKAGLNRSKYYRTVNTPTCVVQMSNMCRTDVYRCRTYVVHISYRCRTYVVHASYICRTGVVHISYRCHTDVVQAPYICRTGVVQMSTGVVQISYRCRTYVLYWTHWYFLLAKKYTLTVNTNYISTCPLYIITVSVHTFSAIWFSTNLGQHISGIIFIHVCLKR